MTTEYNLQLEALESSITVVPALIFSANDSDKLVIAPYGVVVEAIELIESNKQPDDITIVKFKADDTEYRFEFPPGPPAEDALRTLKWFRDMVEFAGRLNLSQ